MQPELARRITARKVVLDDVVDPYEVLRAQVALDGSQAAFNRRTGVPSTYTSGAINRRLTIGPKIYRALGIEPVTVFRISPKCRKALEQREHRKT